VSVPEAKDGADSKRWGKDFFSFKDAKMRETAKLFNFLALLNGKMK
jgi:hypothetical protein